MKTISYKRIYQSKECFSPLGRIRSKALFGGYSLTADNTVFAMIVEGELYLRVCEKNATYLAQHSPPLLMLRKRGCSQQLNYFRVDERLWENRPTLLRLGMRSLEDAQYVKSQRKRQQRLKDLPNLSFHMELLLHDIGIKDAHALQQMGAETAWRLLRQVRNELSINVLFSLEGAITGVHAAALPTQRRQELQEWAQAYLQKP